MCKKVFNVSARKERVTIFMFDFLGKYEHHCHHYQGHMVMPCTPLADLVIRHAALAFRILKRAFNPISLTLHPGKAFKRSRFRCVADGYFDISSSWCLSLKDATDEPQRSLHPKRKRVASRR
jgi:hypothetical protein